VRAFRRVSVLVPTLAAGGDGANTAAGHLRQWEADSTTKLSLAASRFSPHSALAVTMLQELEPTFLPTADEELTWYLDDLIVELKLVRGLQEGGLSDAILRRERDELVWALAVLWKEPLAGSTIDIGARLSTDGVRVAVEPTYAAL
jgi:hypothetical protein